MAAKHILSNLTILLCFSLFFFFFFFYSVSADDEFSCVYTAHIRTSKTWHGGTDAKISLTLYDDTGSGVLIRDLESWGGLMGLDWDYFERGNLDIFSGRGPCLSRPVCYMELTSDGSGSHHSWYCNYVEVTTTGPHIPCAQQLFTVEQWLSTHRSPYELTATRDVCNNIDGLKRRRPSDSLLPVETIVINNVG